jgi:sugar phosphate isomerase/epimerase
VKIAVQTTRLPGDSLDEKFGSAARYGFDAVEVSVGPEFDLASRFEEVRRASEASGLPVCAICTHSIHDPLLPDAAERAERFKGLAELLRMAEELGASGVISVPVRPPHAFPEMIDLPKELEALAAEEFRRWSATLPEGRAAVFLEPLNRYEAFYLRRVEQAVSLAKLVDSPRVVALADLFHMNIEEAHLGEPIRAAGSLLGHVHIADNNRLQPGAGCLDFKTPFRALKEIGYQGYVSIECSALGGRLQEQGPDAMLTATARFLREQWEAA